MHAEKNGYESGINSYFAYTILCLIISLLMLTYGSHRLNFKVSENSGSAGYDYKSDIPWLNPFATIKSEKADVSGTMLKFKELLLENKCPTDMDVTGSVCGIFKIDTKEGYNKIFDSNVIDNKVKSSKGLETLLVVANSPEVKKVKPQEVLNLIKQDAQMLKTKLGKMDKTNVDDYFQNQYDKWKKDNVKYVLRKKGTTGIKVVDSKWNKTIDNLECKYKPTKETCTEACVWLDTVNKDNKITGKGKCTTKWEWFTGADIMMCDECDLASIYCTLKYTTRTGFVCFSILTLLTFIFLIKVEYMDEQDKKETNIRKVVLVIGWLFWFFLVMGTYFFFMLLVTCPSGSDMGNQGINDTGIFDHFRMGWRLIKFWSHDSGQLITTNTNWGSPRFLILIIFLFSIFGLSLGMSFKTLF